MSHPIQPISRYMKKHDIQTNWIKQQRQILKEKLIAKKARKNPKGFTKKFA